MQPAPSLMRCSRVALPLLLLALGCRRGQPAPERSGSSSATPPAAPVLSGPPGSCTALPVNELIRVDQFGYRPTAAKVAVLTDPIQGWNADAELKPGNSYEVREWASGKVVLSGAPSLWRDGSVEASSGDRGFWFDFSALQVDGSYCVVDRERGFRSQGFEVKASVYRDVLRAALKVFYFQRANVPKQKPYACVGNKCWLAAADYVGPGQDKEARSVKDRSNPKTARDLSGGWWDAGDTDRYVTYTQSPLHQLLSAYVERPAPFGDDFGIPESGNGVSDLLDEVKIELDWLQKMQAPDLDGGVMLKLGNVEQGDPTPERSRYQRFYYPGACSSATVVVAGVFAHAALVLGSEPKLKAYAEELRARALRAWAFFEQNPPNTDCDDGSILSTDADRSLVEQEQAAVVAATYLFALTGDEAYSKIVAKDFRKTRPMQDERWSAYDPEQGDALLFYAAQPKAEPSTKKQILQRKLAQAKTLDIYPTKLSLDLYRAYMRDDSYHWGHNMVRANVGNTNLDLLQPQLLGGSQAQAFAERAEEIVHYFHGVNPLGLVYLTNMRAFGAEKSVTQIFHTWFRDGDASFDDAETSRLGPAPGYVPGGPNKQYCRDQDPSQNRCASSRLRQQPEQKAYLDFNTAWDPKAEHDRSWEISEPAIYYQAAYVKLLSKFVD